jgi:hypothetical protein
MNNLHRKGGTMLTAGEVAAVSGGKSARDAAPDVPSFAVVEYPQNPAGPVDTDAAETQLNRK